MVHALHQSGIPFAQSLLEKQWIRNDKAQLYWSQVQSRGFALRMN
jgi:hypothetical protein